MKTSRTASENGKNDGISVFEAKGSILRGSNGNVCFTVIFFFYLNICRIFFNQSGTTVEVRSCYVQ
jgi:hypothetical protein